MAHKLRVGAVSYLNTKPLIYGFEQGMMKTDIDLVIDYPAKIAGLLQNNGIDIGLVPVAVIPSLKEYHIMSDFCIGCDGEVASVCLFSEVPLPEIKTIILDYQSKTSVALLQILLNDHWKISPEIITGKENYELGISGTTAGLIIGDRALTQRSKSTFVFDLGLAWKEMTGLPFVFAAWVANKEMTADFIADFNAANALGLKNLPIIKEQNPFDDFDLGQYYDQYISFRLDEEKKKGLALFLSMLTKG
ncbi:MAG: menaquinone biosynthesis protein [Ferruginibacter sp.]